MERGRFGRLLKSLKETTFAIKSQNASNPEGREADVAINLKGIALAWIAFMEVTALVSQADKGVITLRDYITLSRVDPCGANETPPNGAPVCITRAEGGDVVNFFIPSKLPGMYGPLWQTKTLKEQEQLMNQLNQNGIPEASTILEYDRFAHAWHVRVILERKTGEGKSVRRIQEYAGSELNRKNTNYAQQNQKATEPVRIDLSHSNKTSSGAAGEQAGSDEHISPSGKRTDRLR